MFAAQMRIQNNVDIPAARNMLRLKSRKWKCSPQFRLRALSLLVALSEYALHSGLIGDIDIQVDKGSDRLSVEIRFSCPTQSQITWDEEAKARLESVSDQVELFEENKQNVILARITWNEAQAEQ